MAKALPTDALHYSYAVGLDVGASFRADDVKLDIDSLIAGLRDGLSGAKPKYADEVLAGAVQRLTEQRIEILRQRNLEFLAENAKREGVKTTPTGLQYKVIKSGTGPTPTATDAVRVHYTGQLIDGTVFDSTEGGEPAVLPVNEFIPGWVEALSKMKTGDKWQLYVPCELAYGPEGRGDAIPPHAALVFDIELLGIEK